VPEWWGFLDQGFVVGFRALDDLDLCNIDLRKLLGQRGMIGSMKSQTNGLCHLLHGTVSLDLLHGRHVEAGLLGLV